MKTKYQKTKTGFTPLENPAIYGGNLPRWIPFRKDRVKTSSFLTGYTFVELMIAMVILFLAVMVIGSIFPASFKSLLKSKQVTIATTLAQQKLEECLVNPDSVSAQTQVTDVNYPGYYYDIEKKTVSFSENLEQIKVTTYHMLNNKPIVDCAFAQLVQSGGGVPPGTIVMFGGSAAPNGWLLCNGQSVSKLDYPKLYDAIGTAFGGSGNAFNLPDLRSRFPIGAGQGSGLSNRPMATKSGEEVHYLTIAEMPYHTHGLYDWGTYDSYGSHHGDTGRGGPGNGIYYQTAPTGGGGAHNTIPPYIALNFIIKY